MHTKQTPPELALVAVHERVARLERQLQELQAKSAAPAVEAQPPTLDWCRLLRTIHEELISGLGELMATHRAYPWFEVAEVAIREIAKIEDATEAEPYEVEACRR